MPALVIELCRRCDGRFIARIVRYGRWIGIGNRTQEIDVIFISKDREKQEDAIAECQKRAEKKRWGKPDIAEGIEELPENINMLRSLCGKRFSYKPLEVRVFHDPQMHINFEKVH